MAKKRTSAKASDVLRIAVTFKRPADQVGPTKFVGRMSSAVVESFKPDPVTMATAIAELEKHGFRVSATGDLTVSVRGKQEDFERVFGTKLVERKLPEKESPVQAR